MTQSERMPNESMLDELDSGARGFRASLMDGPDINLFKLARLDDRPDVEDATWRFVNWMGLLDECGYATVVEVGDIDEMPGQSDVFYEVQVDDEQAFSCELRELMLAFLERAQSEDGA